MTPNANKMRYATKESLGTTELVLPNRSAVRLALHAKTLGKV